MEAHLDLKEIEDYQDLQAALEALDLPDPEEDPDHLEDLDH